VIIAYIVFFLPAAGDTDTAVSTKESDAMKLPKKGILDIDKV
jgi:hypothetical protein